MKKALFAILILISAMFATVVFAADYYGYTSQGTFYEQPAYGAYNRQVGYAQYYPTDYYPEKYYYYPRPYDYTKNLYRYGMPQQMVLEKPSYYSFLQQTKVFAQEGTLCGILQNKFYPCASGLNCDIREYNVGVCVRPSTV